MTIRLELPRRRLLGHACAACALGATGLGGLAPAARAADHAKTRVTADEALALLKEGNDRFMNDRPEHRGEDRVRRLELARGQQPFVVLVGCSDSRVSPELLFGRGLGELFIVRNAGNTVDTAALGSIEYAVAELGVPLIVVMGHERCGAVSAALDVVEKDAGFPGVIGEMVEPIIPAVLQARTAVGPSASRDQVLDAAVNANVRRVVARISTHEAVLIEPIKAGSVKIVGARYDLDDGRVDFFDEA